MNKALIARHCSPQPVSSKLVRRRPLQLPPLLPARVPADGRAWKEDDHRTNKFCLICIFRPCRTTYPPYDRQVPSL